MPLVLGPDGERLAKRHGSVTRRDLEAGGIGTAELLSRMGASLGLAAPGEDVDAATLLARFDPDAVPRSPWVFDAPPPPDTTSRHTSPTTQRGGQAVRGIEVPERAEDFTADPVELFFDLGYVLAFSQLVARIIHDPTWSGVGRSALLLWLLWMPWSQFTWSANAVSGNGRPVRLLFLVGTAACIPMAASVSTAYEGGGPVFVLSLAVIYVLALGTMWLATEEHAALRPALLRLGTASLVSVLVTVGGAFLDGDARVVVWTLSALGVVIGLHQAGQGEWIVRTGHFAERHGLIVIIALGEVVVAIGSPVAATLEAGGGVPSSTLLALVGAGVFAGILWWSYFDRPGPALEHRGETVDGHVARGRFARDVYTLGHLPLVAGIILAAAGLEEMALHPDEPAPAAFRAMLAGGLLLGVLGVTATVWRAFRVVARERVVAGAAIAAVLALASGVDGAWLIVLVDAVLLVALAVEHVRIEHPRAEAPAATVPAA